MGEQENPGDSTDYIIPLQDIPAGGYAAESLADYFGIPVGVDYIGVDPGAAGGGGVNALPIVTGKI